MVDEESVEGFSEELVDVSVVLGDAIHEEVEAFDEVADLCVGAEGQCMNWGVRMGMFDLHLRSFGERFGTMVKSKVAVNSVEGVAVNT